MSTRRIALLLTAAGMLMAHFAGAQQTGTQPPADEDLTTLDLSTLMNMDVVVTAQKRPELLSTIPISMTALNTADLEAQGMQDLVDLGRVTPSTTLRSRDSPYHAPWPSSACSKSCRIT